MLRVNLKFLINVSTYIISVYISLLKFSCYLSVGRNQYEMKPAASKRMIRIEKKKKKMAALLEIAKLNEYDRVVKSAREIENNPLSPTETEPNPKRLRTDREKEQNTDKTFCDITKTPSLTSIDLESNNTIELGPSGKPKLYGEEFLKLKKLLREQTNKMRVQPTFRLREMGENASLTVNMENRVPLFLSDIQHLLMYSQIGHHAPYSPARWCALDKYNRLQSTTVVIVENISIYYYLAHESLFPFISSTFETKLEVLTPAAYKSDFVQDLAMIPLTSTQMKKFINCYGTLEKAVVQSKEIFDRIRNLFPLERETDAEKIPTQSGTPADDNFPRTQLLLSGWQLVEENFPLPIRGLMETKYAGYVLTKDVYKEVTPFSPMLGIDCEMCRTTCGDLELTRVSVVDEKMQVFYEQLVKPDNRIVDYLTQFSGITAKMMKNVTKKLKDVQEDLRRILPPDAILVGQSLSNDMHALKLMHPYVIDTSVIFNITGDRMRKTKLATLSREFLQERIQESKSGHCSVEDSLACMKLVKHRLSKTLYYGDAVMGGLHNYFREQPELGHPNYATSMLKQVTKLDKAARVVALEDTITKYNYYTFKDADKHEDRGKIHCISEKSNKAVIERICESTGKYSLNIAHLKVSNAQLEKDNIKTFKNVDKWAKQIYESTPAPGLCVVIFAGKKDSGNGCCFIKLKRQI